MLDEPAAALDPVARRELLRELALRAVDSGMTILFSTHIVSDLERVASHVACLHKQRLMIAEPLDDLGDTHALLVLAKESVVGASGRLPGELSRRRRGDGSLAILLSKHRDSQWPPAVREAGGELTTLGLEDIFIELTA